MPWLEQNKKLVGHSENVTPYDHVNSNITIVISPGTEALISNGMWLLVGHEISRGLANSRLNTLFLVSPGKHFSCSRVKRWGQIKTLLS